MFKNDFETKKDFEAEFENEVRRIARCLWPSAKYDGSAMALGRERDGIFETEECINIIESTTSKAIKEVKRNVHKSIDLSKSIGTKNKPIICWLVTHDEPTADQRSAVTQMVKLRKYDKI